jgi:hypothetical protein
MEDTIVDQKVENLLGVLNWGISESTNIKSTFDEYISFEESVIQFKLESYGEKITAVKKNIETILKYSKTIEELNSLINELFER